MSSGSLPARAASSAMLFCSSARWRSCETCTTRCPNNIDIAGEPIGGLSADAINRRGLARSFQITNLFKGLSIYENLRLSLQARHPARFNAWRDIDSFPEVHAETTELIRFLGLEGIERIEGGELSYGGQRLVDMGIALASILLRIKMRNRYRW